MTAEAVPGRPVAELQPEVSEVTLPSEALKDPAPVLEGSKVTAHAPPPSPPPPGVEAVWELNPRVKGGWLVQQGLLRRQGHGGHGLALDNSR